MATTPTTKDTGDPGVVDYSITGFAARVAALERWVFPSEALARLPRRLRSTLVTFLLLAPIVAFFTAFFVTPLFQLAHSALYDPNLAEQLPEFRRALADDTGAVPGETVFRSLANELEKGREDESYKQSLKSVSQQAPEIWLLLERTTQALPNGYVPSMKRWFVEFNEAWADPDTWRILRRIAAPYTIHYLVASFDNTLEPQGTLALRPKERRTFLTVAANTVAISVWVTLITLGLGYPLAYWLANMPRRKTRVLFLLVLLPVWTPVLVRTIGWVTLLGRQGVINGTLTGLGLTAEPLPLMPSHAGLIVALAHALLPLMVLPCYGVMRGVSPRVMQAAVSLGARPLRAFFSVYVMHTLPGVVWGCLLVFLISAGLYLTPALMALAQDSVLSVAVFDLIFKIDNRSLAAALGSVMIAFIVALLVLGVRRFGMPRVRLN